MVRESAGSLLRSPDIATPPCCCETGTVCIGDAERLLVVSPSLPVPLCVYHCIRTNLFAETFRFCLWSTSGYGLIKETPLCSHFLLPRVSDQRGENRRCFRFDSVLTLLANFLASAAPDRIDRLRGSRRKSFVIVGLSSPRDTLMAEATVSRADAFRVERKQSRESDSRNGDRRSRDKNWCGHRYASLLRGRQLMPRRRQLSFR